MKRAPLRLLVGPVMAAAVIVIVANVATFVAWTAPRWSARWGAAGVSGSVESARQRVEPDVQKMRDTYGRLSRAEGDLDAFRRHLINSTGGSHLLAMLVNAGENAGLDIDDADFQFTRVDELGVVRLGISVPVSGSYRAVRNLLDELLELPVFLVVDGIDMQPAGGSNLPRRSLPASGMIRADLALSVFIDDPEAAAGSPGPAGTPTPVSGAVARDAEALRRAARGNDPEEMADALTAGIAALPPLPVDSESLSIEMDRLDASPAAFEPSRDLFSIVQQAVPAPLPTAEAAAEAVAEPPFPVRLVGVLLIDGRWHASLTDDVALFIAETGDRLPNGIQVVEVGADYVELELGDRRTRLTLEGTRP